MEAGNREEEDRLGTAMMADYPHTPHRHRTQQHMHGQDFAARHQHGDFEYQISFLDSSPATNDNDPRTHISPTHISPGISSHAAANATAFAANDLGFDTLSPDDFYRSYRGVESNPLTGSEENSFMATSTSRVRDNSSLRSNSNGTTPKHPVVPASARNGARTTNLRSVSAPINNDKPGAPKAGGTSVRDLKKKFDQQNAAFPASKVPIGGGLSQRSTPAGSPASKLVGPTTNAAVGNAQKPSYSTFRTSTNRTIGTSDGTQPGSSSRGSQRSKFVAEDQTSSNAQSFASRVSKPRNPAAGNPLASKSMTHLPHKSPSQHPSPRPTSPPTDNSSPPLLFGEILPEQRDMLTVGFGIEGAGTRRRRTSESSILVPSPRQQAFADVDAPLDSPTDWYRQNGDPSQSPSTPRTHQRAQSENTGSPRAKQAQVARAAKELAAATSGPLSASRLPVSVRKLNSPTTVLSPAGSRAASPNLKRPQTNGKLSRATTPTGTRAKTPTQTSRKAAPKGIITPSSNNGTRLNAFISTPPPKLSPPLRSSRPRQPVSVASTASSRLKAIDHPKSPSKSANAGPRTDEQPPRRRKLSVGPIDFERRREQIKLSYTKSIRDSQVSQAKRQQAAARRRTRELEAAARAKSPPAEQPKITLDSPAPDQDVPGLPSPSEPLSISTTPEEPQSAIEEDSPTLGIPGSFPAMSPPLNSEEIPQSAISAASDHTEFDNEPQTTLDTRPAANPLLGAGAGAETTPERTCQEKTRADRPKTEYQYPFEEEEEEPRKDERITMTIALDTTETVPQQEPTPTRQEYGDPSVPGAFKDDYEVAPYAPASYETTVRILRRESELSESQQDNGQFPAYDYEDQEYQLKLDNADVIRHIHHDEDAHTDICTDDNEEPDKAADYYRQVYTGDSSNRASTCESSDAGMLDEHPPPQLGMRRTHEASHSLIVPPMLMQGNRSSQHSTWTDFSCDSSEPSERPRSVTMHTSPLPRQATVFSDGNMPPGQISSLDSTHSRVHSFASDHQLPELDTGTGFSIPYLGKKPLTESPEEISEPVHEPPPIPQERTGSYDSRVTPPNSFYEHPGQSSTLVSRRESEIYTLSTDRTDQTSLEVVDGVTGEAGKQELSGKEKQRLVQRRNVIKELVDTEAVFVRDMNIVEEIYKGTAEACPKLDSKTIKLIFRNTDEIIDFHTSFLAQLKEAVGSIYTIPGRKSPLPKDDAAASEATTGAQAPAPEPDDEKDRLTSLGPVFKANMDKMKVAHEGFLRNSDHAAKRLIQIQHDPTVKVWLNECNEVAKDLTAAWDLDSLLIKPMQRICKYPNLIITLLQHTPQNHPDRVELVSAKDILETAIIEINKTKKNFELVGQIVGRKRKESDVKAGFARAFGKRVDKLQASNNRPPEDPVYAKLHEKFGDDYLRLQVVLRDVEFYTRQVSAYVHEFLQYLSSMELVMRLQASPYPEVEAKWVQFNVGMRDVEKVALDQHLTQVRKHVIEPFELVIKSYGNPSLAMKKRAKRRLDYEKAEQLKKSGKTVDSKLKELVEQYEALNDTLKKELPKLSALTVKIGNICLGNFVNIQADWFDIWKEKVKVVLQDTQVPEMHDIIMTFKRDYQFCQESASTIAMLNPAYKGRTSQSTAMSGMSGMSTDDGLAKTRSRPAELSPRDRGLSLHEVPSLPTPDFVRRHSGQFTMSPTTTAPSPAAPSPHHYYYRDYYAGINGGFRTGGGSPITPDPSSGSRSFAAPGSGRPSTGRSYDSTGAPRQSSDSSNPNRRDSNSTYNSAAYPGPEARRFSGLFHSALPLPDEPEASQKSSRASSRERTPAANGYHILWLAASLFEFNIETTKHEAGYPYLIYQAGEIFDVIAEKGELWLAKNQDDPAEQVGWIWSKHFAKLADS